MIENFRSFDAGPDPFGRVWHVVFRWLQTGISIRHADTVDVKFQISTDAEASQEKVVALPHTSLLELSRKAGRPLTDPWCLKLAALHLDHMIRTFEDMEKALVTAPFAELEKYSSMLEPALARK
jgi:hypothetical protein